MMFLKNNKKNDSKLWNKSVFGKFKNDQFYFYPGNTLKSKNLKPLNQFTINGNSEEFTLELTLSLTTPTQNKVVLTRN